MKTLLIAALALLLPQANDKLEPAALFKKFERTLKESKAFELTFTSSTLVKGRDADTLTGTIKLAKENKAHIEANGTVDGKKFSLRVVSDGNVLKLTAEDRAKARPFPTPAGFNQDVIERFARSSATQMILDLHKILSRMEDERAGARSPEPGLALLAPTPGHFKMGTPETIGAVTRLQLQFVIADSATGDRSNVALWLEQEHLTPAKRSLDPLQERGAKVSEEYTNANFDAKFAKDAFKIDPR